MGDVGGCVELDVAFETVHEMSVGFELLIIKVEVIEIRLFICKFKNRLRYDNEFILSIFKLE